MQSRTNKQRKFTLIWISIIVVLFGVLVIPSILNRIKTKSVTDYRRAIGTSEYMYSENEKLSYVLNAGKPRKMPSFRLINQDSLEVDSSNLSGKVVIVDFFFTSCPTICPIMSRNMALLQDEFKTSPVELVSISINPKYDKPEVLRSYLENYGIINSNWNLLTGDREGIYEIAREGFYLYTEENDEVVGGFEHSGMFALIDKEGYIRSRSDEYGNPIVYYRGSVFKDAGVNSDGEEEQIGILIEDIYKLLKEN
tara:strand:- start:1191 stop:1949 length:759 start_codon:yes stop_codon:yes gene_type:complete